MRALVERAQAYSVVLVASNKRDAAGLGWAQARGIDTWALDSKGMHKQAFDEQLSQALEDRRVGTVALAGFMRILTPWFVARWKGRIINIHPSLLPKYRGLDTHVRALAAGDRVSGCSVHLVTEDLDAGEILGQAEVAIDTGDTPEALEQRVLAAEHRLYPQVLNAFVTR
jgi:phosphoribosylglycinamide formyltransferase-1